MKWIGLLTDNQKRRGYGVTQDEDFVYLWYGRNGTARLVSVFLYETCRIKEVREKTEEDSQIVFRLEV